MSKAEEKIASVLFQAHIKFEREKTFSDLKRGLFRFDFYIPSLNEAGRELNISSQNIGKVCKGIRSSAGRFKWKY